MRNERDRRFAIAVFSFVLGNGTSALMYSQSGPPWVYVAGGVAITILVVLIATLVLSKTETVN